MRRYAASWLASSPDAIPVPPTVVRGCDSLGDGHPSGALDPITHSGRLTHQLLMLDGVAGRLHLLRPLAEPLPTARALRNETATRSLAHSCEVLHIVVEVVVLPMLLELRQLLPLGHVGTP